MAKYLIITTVGSSIIKNYSHEEVGRQLREHRPPYLEIKQTETIRPRSKERAKDYDSDSVSEIWDHLPKNWFKYFSKQDEEWFFDKETAINTHASAEITSLVKIIEDIRKRDNAAIITVQLIATDTALSVLCALLVQAWFKQEEAKKLYPATVLFEKCTDFIQDLRVDLPADWKGNPEAESRHYYDLGLQNLVDKVVGEEGYLKTYEGFHVIINFSGGYKSIIPILTIISQLEGIPMQYIFDDSDDLVEIGGLPIKWDWEVIEKYIGYIQDSGTIPRGSKVEGELVRLNIIQKESDAYSLTIVGKLLSDYLQRDIPFIKTIVGYAVEHKLGSYYRQTSTDFSEVIEGYRPAATRHIEGKNWEDIDLVLKGKLGTWTAVTIKPDSYNAGSIRNELKKLKERIHNTNLDGYGTCNEVWLFLHGNESEPAPIFQPNQIQGFKDCLELDVAFSIKRLGYNRNTVDGRDNRFSFHDFMRNEIQTTQIQTLYSES